MIQRNIGGPYTLPTRQNASLTPPPTRRGVAPEDLLPPFAPVRPDAPRLSPTPDPDSGAPVRTLDFHESYHHSADSRQRLLELVHGVQQQGLELRSHIAGTQPSAKPPPPVVVCSLEDDAFASLVDAALGQHSDELPLPPPLPWAERPMGEAELAILKPVVCPITSECARDAVLFGGHVYERAHIVRWINGHEGWNTSDLAARGLHVNHVRAPLSNAHVPVVRWAVNGGVVLEPAHAVRAMVRAVLCAKADMGEEQLVAWAVEHLGAAERVAAPTPPPPIAEPESAPRSRGEGGTHPLAVEMQFNTRRQPWTAFPWG